MITKWRHSRSVLSGNPDSKELDARLRTSGMTARRCANIYCVMYKYKRNVFKFCNELGKKVEWKELNKEFSKEIEFQVIDEKECKKRINEIFAV